jgi:hypothetical protein
MALSNFLRIVTFKNVEIVQMCVLLIIISVEDTHTVISEIILLPLRLLPIAYNKPTLCPPFLLFLWLKRKCEKKKNLFVTTYDIFKNPGMLCQIIKFGSVAIGVAWCYGSPPNSNQMILLYALMHWCSPGSATWKYKKRKKYFKWKFSF